MPLRSYWIGTHMTGAKVNELSVRNRQHLPLLLTERSKSNACATFMTSFQLNACA